MTLINCRVRIPGVRQIISAKYKQKIYIKRAVTGLYLLNKLKEDYQFVDHKKQ
jgi:hypothetical protein